MSDFVKNTKKYCELSIKVNKKLGRNSSNVYRYRIHQATLHIDPMVDDSYELIIDAIHLHRNALEYEIRHEFVTLDLLSLTIFFSFDRYQVC